MNKIVSFFILILLILMGCATPYQKLSGFGGYLQQKLGEDIYKVTFKGNGYTDYTRAHDLALLRVAEIGRELGYPYLTIEGEEECSRKEVVDMGSTSYTTGSVYGYGNSATYGGTTTTYNNQVKWVKPCVTVIARYYEGEPKGRHLEIHRVDAIINTMESKYGLKLNPH
jgi:hypothetical protein